MSNNIKKFKQDRDRLRLPDIIYSVTSNYLFDALSDRTIRNIESDIRNLIGHDYVQVELVQDNFLRIRINNMEYTIQC